MDNLAEAPVQGQQHLQDTDNYTMFTFSQSVVPNIKSTDLETVTLTTDELIERFKTPSISVDKLKVQNFIRCFANQRNNKACADSCELVIIDGDSQFNSDGEVINYAPPIDDVCKVFEDNNIPYIAYSSHSHQPDKPKYRFVIPSTSYKKDQLEIILDHLFELLHSNNVPLINVKENAVWSQAWFYPSVPNEQALDNFQFRSFEGVDNVTS